VALVNEKFHAKIGCCFRSFFVLRSEAAREAKLVGGVVRMAGFVGADDNDWTSPNLCSAKASQGCHPRFVVLLGSCGHPSKVIF